MTTKSEIITLRLPTKMKEKLELLKAATGRQRTALVIEALDHYLDEQEWQIQMIQEGIAAADAGELVPMEEVESKWLNK